MDYGIAGIIGAESWKTLRRAEHLSFSHAWFYDSPLYVADIFVALAAACGGTGGTWRPQTHCPCCVSNVKLGTQGAAGAETSDEITGGESMLWLWTWGGTCFGYRDGDNLRTYDGRHVGQFYEYEIYGADGRYLGELRNETRLITHLSKKEWQRSGFTPYAPHGGSDPYANYDGYSLSNGYADFPSPDLLYACHGQRKSDQASLRSR